MHATRRYYPGGASAGARAAIAVQRERAYCLPPVT